MLVILIWALLPSYAWAGALKNPRLVAIDDVEGMLYEVPKGEDPHLLEYELGAMGGSALSLTQFSKQKPNFKDVDDKHRLDQVKSDLEDVLTRLNAVKDKLDKGTGTIQYDDIQKSIEGLKKLEHLFRPDVNRMLSSMQKKTPVAKLVIDELPEMDIVLNQNPQKAQSTQKMFYKVPQPTISTERKTGPPVHGLEVTTIVYEVTEEVEVFDDSDYDDSDSDQDRQVRIEETHIETPFKWEVYKAESKKV